MMHALRRALSLTLFSLVLVGKRSFRKNSTGTYLYRTTAGQTQTRTRLGTSQCAYDVRSRLPWGEFAMRPRIARVTVVRATISQVAIAWGG